MTKAERTKRVQRQDRDRQAARRLRMREAGIPETHAVHKAMAEAMSFACARLVRAGGIPLEVRSFLDDWGAAARAILVDRERYGSEAAADAIRKQIKPRREHRDPYFIPSLDPGRLRDDI